MCSEICSWHSKRRARTVLLRLPFSFRICVYVCIRLFHSVCFSSSVCVPLEWQMRRCALSQVGRQEEATSQVFACFYFLHQAVVFFRPPPPPRSLEWRVAVQPARLFLWGGGACTCMSVSGGLRDSSFCNSRFRLSFSPSLSLLLLPPHKTNAEFERQGLRFNSRSLAFSMCCVLLSVFFVFRGVDEATSSVLSDASIEPKSTHYDVLPSTPPGGRGSPLSGLLSLARTLGCCSALEARWSAMGLLRWNASMHDAAFVEARCERHQKNDGIGRGVLEPCAIRLTPCKGGHLLPPSRPLTPLLPLFASPLHLHVLLMLPTFGPTQSANSNRACVSPTRFGGDVPAGRQVYYSPPPLTGTEHDTCRSRLVGYAVVVDALLSHRTAPSRSARSPSLASGS